MSRVRDVTLGQILDATKEYRPFAGLALVVALLLIVLPTQGSSGGSQGVSASAPAASGSGATTGAGAQQAGAASGLGASASGSGAGAADLGGTPGGSALASSGTASVGGTGPAPSGGQTTASATAAPAPTAPGVPAGPWGWRAMKTPAALAAPDCDPSTGYLKMPTKIWNLPCVPMWPTGANNGGATMQGVTKDTITVVIYNVKANAATSQMEAAAGIGDTEAQLRSTIDGLARVYGRHAELYGRHIQLIQYDTDASTPEAQRADAIQVIAKYHPFAVFPIGGSCDDFDYQVALRKTEAICTGTVTLQRLMNAEPYLWNDHAESVLPLEGHLLFTAEFICKQIAGHNAKWAGDPTYRLKPRKFGWLYLDSPETQSAQNLFKAKLAGCGVRPDGIGLSADTATAQQQTTSAIAKLKADGDNVVILDCGFLDAGLATKQATNQAYRPEWLVDGFAYTDATIFIRATYDLSQAAALYGFRETQLMPPYDVGDGNPWYKWENGVNPPAQLLSYNGLFPVWDNLISGIHLAGPILTPETFKDALLARPPIGGVFFHSVTSDARWFGNHGLWPWESSSYFNNSSSVDGAFTWWSNTASCTDETNKNGPGCMMFINGGKRYLLGQLPTGEPDFFNPNTAVGSMAALPPADQPKSYPNKTGCATREACWGTT